MALFYGDLCRKIFEFNLNNNHNILGIYFYNQHKYFLTQAYEITQEYAVDFKKGFLEMEWEKPSAEIISIFEKVVPAIAGIEKRKMFGLPCIFIKSNMFMGVHQNNIFLRLPFSDRKVFLKLEGAHVFEPQPGRIMREYVVFPGWIFEKESADILNDWIYKSFEYAASLPPREKKGK